MNRFTKITILAFSALFALGAYAALFDTIESVDTLNKIAAKQQTTDRMPAGSATDAKAEETETAKSAKESSN